MDQHIFPILSRADYAVTIMTALIRNAGKVHLNVHMQEEIVLTALAMADSLLSKDKEQQDAYLQRGLRPVQD